MKKMTHHLLACAEAKKKQVAKTFHIHGCPFAFGLKECSLLGEGIMSSPVVGLFAKC